MGPVRHIHVWSAYLFLPQPPAFHRQRSHSLSRPNERELRIFSLFFNTRRSNMTSSFLHSFTSPFHLSFGRHDFRLSFVFASLPSSPNFRLRASRPPFYYLFSVPFVSTASRQQEDPLPFCLLFSSSFIFYSIQSEQLGALVRVISWVSSVIRPPRLSFLARLSFRHGRQQFAAVSRLLLADPKRAFGKPAGNIQYPRI